MRRSVQRQRELSRKKESGEERARATSKIFANCFKTILGMS